MARMGGGACGALEAPTTLKFSGISASESPRLVDML